MPKKYIDEQEAKIAWYRELGATSKRAAIAVDLVFDRVPAADVEEVKHGEWKGSDFIAGLLSCDKCGAQRNPNFKIGFGAWNYCPNCRRWKDETM